MTADETKTTPLPREILRPTAAPPPPPVGDLEVDVDEIGIYEQYALKAQRDHGAEVDRYE